MATNDLVSLSLIPTHLASGMTNSAAYHWKKPADQLTVLDIAVLHRPEYGAGDYGHFRFLVTDGQASTRHSQVTKWHYSTVIPPHEVQIFLRKASDGNLLKFQMTPFVSDDVETEKRKLHEHHNGTYTAKEKVTMTEKERNVQQRKLKVKREQEQSGGPLTAAAAGQPPKRKTKLGARGEPQAQWICGENYHLPPGHPLPADKQLALGDQCFAVDGNNYWVQGKVCSIIHLMGSTVYRVQFDGWEDEYDMTHNHDSAKVRSYQSLERQVTMVPITCMMRHAKVAGGEAPVDAEAHGDAGFKWVCERDLTSSMTVHGFAYRETERWEEDTVADEVRNRLQAEYEAHQATNPAPAAASVLALPLAPAVVAAPALVVAGGLAMFEPLGSSSREAASRFDMGVDHMDGFALLSSAAGSIDASNRVPPTVAVQPAQPVDDGEEVHYLNGQVVCEI
jgi:hypothetical protein